MFVNRFGISPSARLALHEAAQAGEHSLPTVAREYGRRQRWDEHDSGAERDDNGHRLQTVDSIFRLRDRRWQGGHVPEHEALKHHQESDGDHGYERILNERLEPTPEQPVELRYDEERYKERAQKRTDGARDQAERYDGQRNGFRERNQQEHHPIDEVGQDRPRVRLDELVRQFVEVLVDIVERPGLEHRLEVERLVGDQIAERNADPRQRRPIEGKQRITERDDQQQLGEPEHGVAEPLAGEHHLDAMPHDDDGCERQKQPVPEAEELRFVRQQKPGDPLLNPRL